MQGQIPPSWAWSIIFGLSLLWVGLGYYLGRNSKTLESFALAGRNVGLALGSATAVATWITSNTTLLAPQFAIQLGIWGMLAYSTAAFGLFLFAPLARRIQRLMPCGFTSGDFLRLRFGPRVWGIFMVISILYAITWLVSMTMAAGFLLETIAGIPYFTGMSIVIATCVAYTLLGGMRAVIGTDFVQSLIILLGILVIGFLVIQHVPLKRVYHDVTEQRPALMWFLMPAAIMAVFNNLMFGIGEIFHSNIWWSRAFAIRPGLGHKAYLIGSLVWLPIPIAAGFVALSSGSLGINITSPDMVGPLVAADVLGQMGTILVLIVIFCSLASSIDSLLAATSDLLANDIYRRLLSPGATHAQTKVAIHRATILLGLLAWALSSLKVATLAEVLFFAGPLVGSTIWPILAGLYWPRAQARGVACALLLGSAGGLYAYFGIGWFAATLVATMISMLCTILSCVHDRQPFDFARLKET